MQLKTRDLNRLLYNYLSIPANRSLLYFTLKINIFIKDCFLLSKNDKNSVFDFFKNLEVDKLSNNSMISLFFTLLRIAKNLHSNFSVDPLTTVI